LRGVARKDGLICGWRVIFRPRIPNIDWMPTDMTEHPSASNPDTSNPASRGAEPAESPRRSSPSRKKGLQVVPKRKALIALMGIVVLAAVLTFGIPYVQQALNTVSTDDAYVNGHVTFVAPRVAGQVVRVLVDDNNRVRKGDLIVQLDKEPYQIAVSEKRAAVDIANADLQVAAATVRGFEAQARSTRWKLQNAVQDVDNQIALLHARVAVLDENKAAMNLAQVEFARAKDLVGKGFVSRELYDQRQEALTTAGAAVAQALAEVRQIRSSLGLAAQPDKGDDLDHVPPDLDETFSSVLEAQSELIQSAAQLGVIHSYEQSPKQMLEQFQAQGDINRTFARLLVEAPAIKLAEAKLESAKRDLAQAELNLSYCDIIADINGVITRRNVNPGDYVQVGQNLMAIRSLDEIWIDANFKETQLGDMRIGQPVDLHVDMYGGRIFKGRVAGFTMGTGSTLALLPAENATGNFIKVVQRLPVRIELEGYDLNKTPLFIGTSVVPYVYINKPATGPDAGKFLQARIVPQSQTSDTLQRSTGPSQ
jgi:membrane fusion protein, multidrug efflux system